MGLVAVSASPSHIPARTWLVRNVIPFARAGVMRDVPKSQIVMGRHSHLCGVSCVCLHPSFILLGSPVIVSSFCCPLGLLRRPKSTWE